ncbi:hypothetical protein [Pseudonocardia sp. ICBG1293]|uniref:hypothetical protein n=1 Tax=Pseudonocardia sp. ICBG1293 TaxID=2844382 RepID=UPI001CCF35B8|nr:hypothetical protein [Pseudonocardia sp. ICBG1293]
MTSTELQTPSWPDTLRAAAQRTGSVLREIWVGIDTWSAVTHGGAPMRSRPRTGELTGTRS